MVFVLKSLLHLCMIKFLLFCLRRVIFCLTLFLGYHIRQVFQLIPQKFFRQKGFDKFMPVFKLGFSFIKLVIMLILISLIFLVPNIGQKFSLTTSNSQIISTLSDICLLYIQRLRNLRNLLTIHHIFDHRIVFY